MRGDVNDAVNFAVYSSAATAVSLVLWTPEDLALGKITAEIELDERENKTGSVWHIALPKCADDVLYGYRVDGPYEPEAGHRFDRSKVLLDPYAKATVSRARYGEPGTKADGSEDCWPQYAGAVPKRGTTAGLEDFDWEGVTSPKRPNTMLTDSRHPRSLRGSAHPCKFYIVPRTWESFDCCCYSTSQTNVHCLPSAGLWS